MFHETEQSGSLQRRFRLMMRCHNCMRESAKVLDFGDDEDAPADVDELMESAALDRVGYRCADCDSAIGMIVSVSQSRGRRA